MQEMIDQCINMMNGMLGGNMMGGMMGGMMLPMLLGALLLIVLVGSVLLLLRHVRSTSAPSSSQPLTILQERFARGELDPEEYQSRLSILQGSR